MKCHCHRLGIRYYLSLKELKIRVVWSEGIHLCYIKLIEDMTHSCLCIFSF